VVQMPALATPNRVTREINGPESGTNGSCGWFMALMAPVLCIAYLVVTLLF
jgi:hypothetical protein